MLFNQSSTPYRPRFSSLLMLFLAAFFIRAALFIFFIQPAGYYHQPDSVDYHNCALSLVHGYGMSRIDNGEPIFWRTPGYPLYLAVWYYLFPERSLQFKDQKKAHAAAIAGQIVIGAFFPVLIFYLAYLLTANAAIAWIAAFISLFHLGLMLATSYILTEGIALFFFYLFLFYLFRLFTHRSLFFSASVAATMLAIYTWMRPMGECVALVTAGIILFLLPVSFKKRLGLASFFLALFFALLAPWYIRNVRLTGELFFCPTIGTYLNCFSVPKILRRVNGQSIENCLKMSQQAAAIEAYKKRKALEGTGLYCSPAICKKVSVPIVLKYPAFFLIDWAKEVCKTTFDLYACQLVSMANDTFFYDPIEEFITQKYADALYHQPMPALMRIACWLDLIYFICVWVGLLIAFIFFLIKPLFSWATLDAQKKNSVKLLCACILLAGAVIAPTGGFGYARLRLPIEPLMIIVSVAGWYYLVTRKR